MSAIDPKVDLASLAKFLIKNYDPRSMNFLLWLNHFEYMCDYLHIPSTKMGIFLLHFMEPICLTQIEEKVAPANPRDFSYEQLISHFEYLYGIYQGEMAATYRFHIRDQMVGENVIQYKNRLEKLMAKVTSPFKNDHSLMLRFLHGLRHEDIRQVLKSFKNLTPDNVVNVAAHFELYKIWYQNN